MVQFITPPPRKVRSSLGVWRRFVVSFVPSVAPRVPLSCSEPLRRRLGRAPREGARTHAERGACGRPARGVRTPRALGESAAAFARRSSLEVWRCFNSTPPRLPPAFTPPPPPRVPPSPLPTQRRLRSAQRLSSLLAGCGACGPQASAARGRRRARRRRGTQRRQPARRSGYFRAD